VPPPAVVILEHCHCGDLQDVWNVKVNFTTIIITDMNENTLLRKKQRKK